MIGFNEWAELWKLILVNDEVFVLMSQQSVNKQVEKESGTEASWPI